MTKPSTRMLLIALVVAWVSILLTAMDCPAQLYRYVDKQGNVVLTDNPPPGVAADTIEQGNAVLQPSKGTETQNEKPAQVPGVRPAPPTRGGDQAREEAGKVAKEEADKVAKEEADKVAREETDRVLERKMADEAARKQSERQQRLEEADRLEQEARKPVQPTQENIDRQLKLMQDAQRLRDTP